ncbi:Uncharacterized protein Rs2_22003 [Raphanus sativus]|uniref:Uncharacterized protein LOC108853888 isoform X3 n=1 Tax=Raphanus sativus TaxID=3726 RepID=A0A6J0NE97_RAPSA|nr:uncharacterized protein LOC108853888 isoform X3 [Raphanus sativus]KAJ4895209.1 Uncharacterized protein Rs2_22003 [Raphanus sativus]
MRPWRVQDGGVSTIKRTSHSSFTVEVHLLRFTSAEVENKSGVFLTNWRSICTDSGNPERKRAYGPDMLFLNEKPRFTPTHSSVNSHRLKKYKHLYRAKLDEKLKLTESIIPSKLLLDMEGG